MRRAFVFTLLCAFFCLGLSWVFSETPQPAPALTETMPTPASVGETEPGEGERITHTGSVDEEITLEVLMEDGIIRTMTLRQYLLGVMLGELPWDFPPEAQKAQAVVCRTYTLRRLGRGRHGQADVCTDSQCCQAWQEPEGVGEKYLAPARTALEQTDGQVLYYDGELIDATFFSASGGRTEAAVAVWGTDVPYLQTVESPGEEAPYDGEELVFTPEQCREILRKEAPELILEEDPHTWFGEPVLTSGLGVMSMELGGRLFTGQELRRMFGLRSTAFTVSIRDGAVVFQTRGFGHRVGMSQYGARAMALAGESCAQILTHYYRGVTLETYTP